MRNKIHPKSGLVFLLWWVVFASNLQASDWGIYPITVRNLTGTNVVITFPSASKVYLFPPGVTSAWVEQAGDEDWTVEGMEDNPVAFTSVELGTEHQIYYDLTLGGNGAVSNSSMQLLPYERWDLYVQSTAERRWQWTTGFCFAGILMGLGIMLRQGKNVVLKTFTHT